VNRLAASCSGKRKWNEYSFNGPGYGCKRVTRERIDCAERNEVRAYETEEKRIKDRVAGRSNLRST